MRQSPPRGYARGFAARLKSSYRKVRHPLIPAAAPWGNNSTACVAVSARARAVAYWIFDREATMKNNFLKNNLRGSQLAAALAFVFASGAGFTRSGDSKIRTPQS
jgi:hypothetical protein